MSVNRKMIYGEIKMPMKSFDTVLTLSKNQHYQNACLAATV